MDIRIVKYVTACFVVLAVGASSMANADDDLLLFLPAMIHAGGSSSTPSSVLPDTGITACYDNDSEIPCPEPGEPFYGQDAQFVRSRGYRDNGDGTVTDLATGLLWQQEDSEAGLSWVSAAAFCGDLSLAGHSDWRLPTIKELAYLVDLSKSPRFDPVFSVTTTDAYWSSTFFDWWKGGAYWVVFVDDSSWLWYYRAEGSLWPHARCVRSGL